MGVKWKGILLTPYDPDTVPGHKEPRWLSRNYFASSRSAARYLLAALAAIFRAFSAAIDAIQIEQLKEHGGLPGIRDENALESALGRARNKWVYGKQTDLAVLAAAYGFGLVGNHPYFDGNKRIGFLALVTFPGINGYDFRASDVEVVTEMLKLAGGQLSEEQLAAWIKQHLRKAK